MPASSETILRELRDHIASAFLVDFGNGVVTVETDLFASDHLDSFGFVDLIAHVEQTYAVKFTEDDLISPAVGSVAGLHDLVMKRLAG